MNTQTLTELLCSWRTSVTSSLAEHERSAVRSAMGSFFHHYFIGEVGQTWKTETRSTGSIWCQKVLVWKWTSGTEQRPNQRYLQEAAAKDQSEIWFVLFAQIFGNSWIINVSLAAALVTLITEKTSSSFLTAAELNHLSVNVENFFPLVLQLTPSSAGARRSMKTSKTSSKNYSC